MNRDSFTQATPTKTALRPVQVLLSTFNGQRYLSEQLDSLLAQDYPQIEILVRDDGSTDATWGILQAYAAEHPSICVYQGEHLGATGGFFNLIEKSSPHVEFLAFSDQDDVWLPRKITDAVNHLAAHEDGRPCLYCSRVTMTDSALRPIRKSDLPRRPLSFHNALVETTVRGCTTVINRQARMLLLRELPQSAATHDSWIYLVISAFGKVIYDKTPTMLYRRHRGNSSGVPVSWLGRWRVQFQHMRHDSGKSMLHQAEEFQRIFGNTLQGESASVLANFLNSRHSFPGRLRYALRGEVYHQSVLGNLLFKCLFMLDRVHA